MASHKNNTEISEATKELQGLLSPRFKVDSHLGTGGAGIVFQVTDQATGVIRVAKLLRHSAREFKDIQKEFEREAKRLAALRHSNLVTVFEQSPPKVTPYFIMEFIEGKTLDKSIKEIVEKSPKGEWVKEIRKIAIQLSDVLAYLHSRSPALLHLDIKPENIILSRQYDNTPLPILLDFGISREADYVGASPGQTDVRGTFPMWPRKYYSALKKLTTPERTLFQIKRDLIRVDLDLHLLGITLKMLLNEGEANDSDLTSWDLMATSELRFLKDIVSRLDIDEEDAPQFDSAGELREALVRLELEARRSRRYFDEGIVKIPGVHVRSYGAQVRKLTDWSKFQRLRGILQLGLTHLVYPGAVHTRFEHSLGVFENALNALDQISGPLGDFRFRSVVSDEELAGTAIVALLHDVGHYPFAHQFRLRGAFPRHEKRTIEALESDELKTLIEKKFNSDVHQAVVGIMRFVLAHDDSKSGADPITGPSHYRVLRDIISGSFDVDKLDYVHRDALHTGVPYGQIVDRERFFASLRVYWNDEGEPELLLSDKGRVCAEGLVFARYLMTSEVYWNHAVRAYAAMLTATIDRFKTDEIHEHLWDTDSEFLSWLTNDIRGKWLGELIQCRSPYRRAFVHQRLGGRFADEAVDKRLFEKLESAASKDEKDTFKIIKEVVCDVLNLRNVKRYEFVIDVPAGMTSIDGVKVLPEGHLEPGSAGPIFEGIGNNFNGFARKARIFVHPRLMEGVSVAESTKKVRQALIKRFNLR